MKAEYNKYPYRTKVQYDLWDWLFFELDGKKRVKKKKYWNPWVIIDDNKWC